METDKHRLLCADIMSEAVDSFLAGQRFDVIYTDPPWGDANLKYWNTLLEKYTGKRINQPDYKTMMTRLFELIEKHLGDGIAFIETGLRWGNMLEDIAPSSLTCAARDEVFYRSGSKWAKNYVLQFVRCGNDIEIPSLAGARGVQVVERALEPFSGLNVKVLDPFCGKGQTARVALKYGMTFYGIELNPVRLEKTKKVFEK